MQPWKGPMGWSWLVIAVEFRTRRWMCQMESHVNRLDLAEAMVFTTKPGVPIDFPYLSLIIVVCVSPKFEHKPSQKQRNGFWIHVAAGLPWLRPLSSLPTLQQCLRALLRRALKGTPRKRGIGAQPTNLPYSGQLLVNWGL